MLSEKKFMELALKLAEKGKGFVSPNPLVGCVVVKNGKIVGKGFHKKFGESHAEIIALYDAGKKAKNATLYTNLEPCCHFGKTPPCVEQIINAGIKKVVVAMLDPNPLVNGKGVKALKKQGIEVKVGLMEEKARKLNECFEKFIVKKKPFVVLKSALTLDGKISWGNEKQKITCEESLKKVHKLRAELDAVVVGVNTVLKDNPRLTVRKVKGRNPVRIVVDSKLRIPLNARVLSEDGKVIVACTKKGFKKEKVEKLKKLGAEVLVVNERKKRVCLRDLMKKLALKGIANVLIEGGASINESALEEKIVDKMLLFFSPKVAGKGLYAFGNKKIDEFSLKNVSVELLGKDLLIEGYLS